MLILNVSYSKNPSEVEPHIKSHGVWVGRYLKEGVFLFAGPKKSGLGGVIAVQSMSKEKLTQILAEDSYVQADVADYQIIDFDCKATQATLEALKLA